MKTKTISNEQHTALVLHDKKIKTRLYVKWYENNAYSEIKRWPNKADRYYDSLESLLVKVREYAEKNNLTLWSY